MVEGGLHEIPVLDELEARPWSGFVSVSRCKMPNCNEYRAHRTSRTRITDDVYHLAPPYESKSKNFGCPNDCMNSIEHSDFANIGIWRNARNRSERVDPYPFLIQIKDGGGARANNPLIQIGRVPASTRFRDTGLTGIDKG